MKKFKILSSILIIMILSSYLPIGMNLVNAMERKDIVFESELLEQFMIKNYDTDGNHKISVSEMEQITDLVIDFSKEDQEKEISLEGIQYGKNIENIQLNGNFTNYTLLEELANLKTIQVWNSQYKTEKVRIQKGQKQEIEFPELLERAYHPDSKLYVGEDAKMEITSSNSKEEPSISLDTKKMAIIIDTTNANIGDQQNCISFDIHDTNCPIAGTNVLVEFEVYEEEKKDEVQDDKEDSEIVDDSKEEDEDVEQEEIEQKPVEEEPTEDEEIMSIYAKEQIPQVAYQGHVQNIGWMSSVKSGETAGLAKSGNNLEAIRISLANANGNAHITYQTHVSNVGWQNYVQDGTDAGTTGQNKAIEAIRIRLEGISGYSVEYRTCVKNQGWQQWVADGITAGTTGQSTTIEAIQIRIVKTQDVVKATPEIAYSGHVQNIGWMNHAHNGETAGLAKSGNNLEAIRINLVNVAENAHIKYQVHVQNIGWKNYVQDGNDGGTSGQNRAIEAIRIKLEGISGYSVEYRTCVKNQGWQQWVADGITAGTTGQSTTIEAIQIRIVKTQNITKSNPEVAYSGHVQNVGWMTHAHNGETAGLAKSGNNLEAIRISLVNVNENAHIKYQVHVNNVGWRNYVQDGHDGGTTGQGRAMEAIRIKLEGLPGYSVEYRTYVKNQGWQQWVADGITAGTTGQNTTIEAIQIRIVKTQNVTKSKLEIAYSTHVQNVGWMPYVHNGATAGMESNANAIESIRINLVNASEGAHIKYQVHVSNVGWQNYVQDGLDGGTTGQKRGVEAIRIQLEGVNDYIVEYRAYVKGKGWQQWASNGMMAGSIGQSLTIQAIQIRIVKKENTVVPGLTYSGYIQNVGWMNAVKDGGTSGLAGKGLNLEALKVNLTNASGNAHVKYQAHVQDVGWQSEVQDGQVAGTIGKTKGLEAIRVYLEGLSGYTIEYRAYVRGKGWQEWVLDGLTAGTTGQSVQIEAIEMRIAIQYGNTSSYLHLEETRYPGYKALLQQIQSQHPNWTIGVYYTNLDWNTVISQEDQFVGGSPKNLIQDSYKNEWINGTTKYDVSQRWYRASRKAIAYMMDPRNSLSEAWMFQFQDLSSSSGTRSEIAKMVSGTFLNKDSVIDAILTTAKEQGISPFHIVSRIIQEQGSNGSGSMNGNYEYLGKKVYNLFNINVSGNTSVGLLAGARYAYERGWFTPEASIKGGAEFLKKNYISKGQCTLYYQKYNVVNTAELYGHQYMQNIRAANDEGNMIYNSYKKNGILDSHFEFIIPVYENMPKTASPRPNN